MVFPCVEEFPSLSRLAEEYKDKIFVVAISSEPKELIVDFLGAFPDISAHFKIATVSGEIQRGYFPEDTLPATYIFDLQGRLKAKELGAREWEGQKLIQNFLNSPP